MVPGNHILLIKAFLRRGQDVFYSFNNNSVIVKCGYNAYGQEGSGWGRSIIELPHEAEKSYVRFLSIKKNYTVKWL